MKLTDLCNPRYHLRFFWRGIWGRCGSAMGSELRLVPRQRRQRQHHDGKKARSERLHKDQGFSDAEAANVIKNGKGKMKAYKQLSDADVKALVAYVRSLKK